MTREDLVRILVEMGFAPARAAQLPDALLAHFAAKGLTTEQALQAVGDDLRAKGPIHRQLEALRQKEPKAAAAGSASACPKCGHPRSAQALDCGRCGIVFAKLARASEAPAPAPAPLPRPEAAALDSPAATTDEGPRSPGAAKARGLVAAAGAFAGRHKIVSAVVGVLVLLFAIGLVTRQVERSRFAGLLRTFDEQLAMGTPEEFARSLENMKSVIENATWLLARLGKIEGDAKALSEAADERYQRFTEAMRGAAEGGERLHGHDVGEVRRSLCGGMKMVLLNVRNEEAQRSWGLALAVRGGGYLRCEVSDYQPSAKASLRRDGDGFVLRPKRPGEEEPRAAPAAAPGGQVARDPRRTGVGLAANELHMMQGLYRKRHGSFCGDARALLADYESQGRKASALARRLIESGELRVELSGSAWRVAGPEAEPPMPGGPGWR